MKTIKRWLLAVWWIVSLEFFREWEFTFAYGGNIPQRLEFKDGTWMNAYSYTVYTNRRTGERRTVVDY